MRFISYVNGCCCNKKVGQRQESIKEEIIIQEDYLRTIYDIMLGAIGEASDMPEFEVFSLGMTQLDIDYVYKNLEPRKEDPIAVLNERGGGENDIVRSLFESIDGIMLTPIVAYQDAVGNYYILVEYVEDQNVSTRSVCYIFSANV